MSTAAEVHRSEERRVTGDAFIWLLILADMSNFVLAFAYFGHVKQDQAAVFASSQATLSLATGAANSLILLLSSWFMVLALRSSRRGQTRLASRFVIGTLACGLLFTGLKASEFLAKSAAGIGFGTNDFYTLYYALTGLHFTHVVVGVGVLLSFVYVLRYTAMTPRKQFYFETAAMYWHMVDLLWIIIFTLLYLVPV